MNKSLFHYSSISMPDVNLHMKGGLPSYTISAYYAAWAAVTFFLIVFLIQEFPISRGGIVLFLSSDLGLILIDNWGKRAKRKGAQINKPRTEAKTDLKNTLLIHGGFLKTGWCSQDGHRRCKFT